MWGVPKELKPTPPAEKQIKNPGGAAPSGRSVAGSMVQNSRTKARSNVPHAPRPGRGGGGKKSAASPPFNPMDSPYKTQGQFNQAVSQVSKAQYQPELDQYNHEEAGETGLHGQREGENASAYATYSAQAKEAFERSKNALAEIAARQNAGTDAAQKALQAALGAGSVPGGSTVANPTDFMAEAAGYGNQSNATLGGIQSAVLGEAGQAQNIPGAWRDEAQLTERQRNQSELNKIGEGRTKTLANVPNIQSKVRKELSEQEFNRAQGKLQTQIAQNKLGLEKQDVAGKRTGEKEQIGAKRQEAQEANRIKLEEMSQNAGFKWAEIDVQRKDLATKAAEARNGKEKAAAELAGKRFDKGLELMAGYLKKNDKTEFDPTNPEAKNLEGKGEKVYNRKAADLYQKLTKQGNLTAPEAFRIMASSGNGYVEEFAREHESIYNREEATRRKAGGPLSTLPKPPRKGQKLPTLRAPSR